MFLGTYSPKLDDKGRFFLPAKFRDDLKEGLVITRQHDGCLAIWPAETFLAEAAKAAAAPVTVAANRGTQRMFASAANSQVPDGQGRLTVPPPLRSYAHLDRDIVVIGVLNRVEVWDAEAWKTYSEAQEAAFSGLNEEVPPPQQG